MTGPASTRSGALAAGLATLLAAPAPAQPDLSTPDGAVALLAETCPFESLEGPSSARVEGAQGGVGLALASRDGFRSCELTLRGAGEAFHAEMAEALSGLIGGRYEIDVAETLPDGLMWRWEPREGLRGQAELTLAPTGDVAAVVSLERGELMEDSE